MAAWTDVELNMERRRPVVGLVSRLALGAAFGVTLSSACNNDPDSQPQFAAHCNSVAGDATCLQAHPSRPYCSLCLGVEEFEGCVASPPPPACVSGGGSAADGGGTGDDGGTDDDGTVGTTSDSGEGDTVAADDTSSSGDTDSIVPCEQMGTRDPTCVDADPTRPFCIAGACADCIDAGGDGFCSELDPMAPACDAGAGACVPCNAVARAACTDLTPVCDQDAGTCIPCTEHVHCAETACHRSAADPLHGSCFGADEVVWVDSRASCPGMGSEANPYCSVAPAVADVPAGEARVIRLRSGPFDEDILLETDATVAIIGEGSPSVVSSGAGAATVTVSGDAVLYLSGVQIIDNATQDGIDCAGGVVSLSDAEISGNGRWGVHNGGPCEIEIDRTTVHHNALGGVRMLGGHLWLSNATVAENGDGLSGAGLVLVSAQITAVYSTVVGNDAFGPDTLQCDGDVAGTVRNSILHGADNESAELACFMLDVENSAVDSAVFSGGDNVAVGAYQAGFFTNPGNGDFRLAAPPLTPYGDIAQWQDGDPLFDADGTQRPTDALGYAGIDEP